jgi:ribonuclease P protein 3
MVIIDEIVVAVYFPSPHNLLACPKLMPKKPRVLFLAFNQSDQFNHLETDSLQGGNNISPPETVFKEVITFIRQTLLSLLFDSCRQDPHSPPDFAFLFKKMSEHASDPLLEASESLQEEIQHADETKTHIEPDNDNKLLSSMGEEKSELQPAEQQGLGPVEEKEKAKPLSPQEGAAKEEVESLAKMDTNGHDENKPEQKKELVGDGTADRPTREGSNSPSFNDEPPPKKQKLEVELSFVEEKQKQKSPKDMKESEENQAQDSLEKEEGGPIASMEQIKKSSTSGSTPWNEQFDGEEKPITISDSTKDIEDEVMPEPETATERRNETNEKDEPTVDQTNNNDDAQVMESEESEQKSNDQGDKEKSDGDKPKPKHIRKKDVNPMVLEVRRRIQVGCRFNDLATAMEVYEEALANDVRVEAQSFYNLLNLCDGLERAVHIGTPKSTGSTDPTEPPKVIRSVDGCTRQKNAFRIKQRMDELKLPLNETAFTALVKVLCRNKQVDQAEKLLDDAERIQQCRPKLRLYSAILITHCELGNLKRALQVWKRLTDQNIAISEKEYTLMMQCAVSIGSSMVTQSVLSDLAEDVLVPSKDSVAAILQWYESPHAIHKGEVAAQLNTGDINLIRTLLEEIHQKVDEVAPSMGPVVCTKGWVVSSMCPIDIQTGILQKGCLKGCQLKPVALSDRSWAEMKRMNESIVVDGELEGHSSKFQGGRKGKKRRGFSPEERKATWARFCEFLDKKGDLDVVLDGANIGYFQTNFAGASKHVDYVQINWIVQHFLKLNKKVLLVLHERHFASHLMPAQYRPLVEEWERMGVLYQTPPGMNDDWFWLHAALMYRTLVITNDEMRDHHFQMLAPRMFLRWKDRHMIHFSFGTWTPNKDGGPNVRQIELVYPEIYSRRIQRVEDGLVVPLAKRGDLNRFLDGSHIACDDEPIEETYLCIRPCAVAQASPVP